MAREFVPGVGPTIGGEANTRLEGSRSNSQAAPVAPAAAATAEIFAAGERINVRTRIANEQIRCTLCVDRDNAGAAGNGSFQLLIDGVAAGTARIGPTGTAAQGGVIIDQLVTIAAAGTHTVSAQVTSNGDVETVSNSILVVQANEFTTS